MRKIKSVKLKNGGLQVHHEETIEKDGQDPFVEKHNDTSGRAPHADLKKCFGSLVGHMFNKGEFGTKKVPVQINKLPKNVKAFYRVTGAKFHYYGDMSGIQIIGERKLSTSEPMDITLPIRWFEGDPEPDKDHQHLQQTCYKLL